MYEHIYWGSEPFCSLLTAVPALYDRTVTVNGVSKSYAMTGWRIGYCGGPPEIIEAMATIQSQSTTNPSSIAQKAATAALLGDQSCVTEMNRHFKSRHDFFNDGLNRLPGFKVLPAAGTFYAWCDVTAAIAGFRLPDDDAFAEHLLEQAGVAGVPGSGFGGPGHIRFSFATSRELLAQALERIGRATGLTPRGRIRRIPPLFRFRHSSAVEQLTVNQRVRGSNPRAGANPTHA